MTDNDQAAVEALMQVKVNTTDYACNGWGSPYGASARAILDAIRKGEVPIHGMVTEAVWRAAEAECDRLAGLLGEARESIEYGVRSDPKELLDSIDAALAEIGGGK